MARPRKRNKRHWPDNLYCTKNFKGEYYFYRIPANSWDGVSKRDIGLGYDFEEAKLAAKQANEHFSDQIRINKILQRNEITFSDYLPRYRNHLDGRRVKGKPLSEHTLKEYDRILRVFNEHESGISQIPMNKIEIYHISALLESFPVKSRNKYRALLLMMFDYAIADGARQQALMNPAEATIPTPSQERSRGRLTLEMYKVIFDKAEKHVRVAMELSLNLMQRREDIRHIKYQDEFYEEDPDYIHIIQSKTQKHSKSAYLRIPKDAYVAHSSFGCKTIQDIFEISRDRYTTPYVVHHKGRYKILPKDKDHWTQLSGQQISNGFATARDATGLFDKIPADERPTFHELIALGEYLRREQGWSVEQIQAWRGHTSAKMTRHYLEGHDWTTVKAPKVSIE